MMLGEKKRHPPKKKERKKKKKERPRNIKVDMYAFLFLGMQIEELNHRTLCQLIWCEGCGS